MTRARLKLKAPFPYFGGKSRVADLVWGRLGDCDNVIEPFCGSCAFLLARSHAPRVETVNDADCYVANFWRATAEEPHAVAVAADWPVNEADLHARHRWLVLSEDASKFRERMRRDPHYFDTVIAGWWCWGLCCWIGGGWCTPHGETLDGGRKECLPLIGQKGKGANKTCNEQRRPVIANPGSDAGKGVHGRVARLHEKQPVLPDNHVGGRGVNANGRIKGLREKAPTAERCQTGGKGVNGAGPCEWEQFPYLDRGGGQGINANGRPQLADAYDIGRGVHSHGDLGTCAQRLAWLKDWFGRLRDRFRTVRVCCGHWRRVCESESVTTRLGVTGVFLDPPYPTHTAEGAASRDGGLYANDGQDLDTLRDEVLAWCRERGGDPMMRIAVCGYDTDGYAALEALGWECVAWKAQGGYANRRKGNVNRGRERIWFSPQCQREATLFDLAEQS
ncbi:MAG: DNA adenine methylase [Patescibacteria group bacterium]|nr:DNA adenine methylase [Patescibacteria group bacterium]